MLSEAIPRRCWRPSGASAVAAGCGVLVGVAVLGPALGPGGLFNLDLVITPFLSMPRGVWGLGPELPRRALLDVAMASVSGLGLSGVAWRALMLGAFGSAFAGAARLARPAPPVVQAGAGLLFSLSPFMVTRVAVGHSALVVATALLPWALPTLAAPGRSPRRTFVWLCVFSLCGVFGGLLAASVVACALVADRPKNAHRVIGGVVLSQLPWVVPGIILLSGSPDLTDSSAFLAKVARLPGGFDVLAGHGFWSGPHQVGGNGNLTAAVLGLGLLALAFRGHRRLPEAWRRGAGAAALVGLLVPLAGALAPTRALVEAVTGLPLGAPFRDTQRLLAMYLVWLAPAAALGAEDLAAHARGAGQSLFRAVPLATALVLGGPGLFGVNGRLEPTAIPDAWYEARELIADDPGTVLALPWENYLDLQNAGSRRVHHPAPVFLDGDVMVSSDLDLPESSGERLDPREPVADDLVARMRSGAHTSEALADLGVRWVFLLRTTDWATYTGLFDDPGLDLVVDDGTLALYEVREWSGPVTTASSREFTPAEVVPPLLGLSTSEAATWNAPAQPGWRRGWRAAEEADNGLLRLPSGGGVVWFWPSILVVVGTAAAYGTAAALMVRAWRGRRPGSSAPADRGASPAAAPGDRR